METTKMKIEYRKQIDSETAPWQLLTNMDELLWNGIYNLRVADDDGTHSLPFRFANDDTVTLVVKDHAHEGMLENGRTIVQTITRVERSTGNVLSYTRTRYNSNGIPTWTYWTLATEDDAVIEIPKATPVSLGAVIVGDGLAVDADGKLSVAGKSIGEECLISALNDKINVAATKANATDLFVQNSGLALHYGALLQNDAPYPGTDLRVHTDKILSGGEQFVVNDGYVISTLKIFDGEQEIAYANNLSETRYTLDAKGLHYQFEFSKLNMTPFTDDELSQVIKAYQRRPIVWSSAHHINHFVAAGTYNIVGQRTNSADGLPIANAASGHSINARLVVLDSSIPAGSKESDKCITQILTLSNRVGGDGDIYVRTGRAADTAHLIAGNGWGAWGKLQQNIEVGQTTSLDAYIDNGIYSGVYTNGSTLFETFVMVVINNYAVAAATGTARNITQVKYAVDTNGVFCYHARTGQGAGTVEWGEWRDLDAVTTSRIQDGAVTAQKLSSDVREKVENFSTTPILSTKQFFTLPNPTPSSNAYQTLSNETLKILGQDDVYLRMQALKEGGCISRIFAANTYNIQVGIPAHFVSYIYSNIEQNCYHQLYLPGTGYLVNNIEKLKIGWNKLGFDYTFETVPQDDLFYYLGKVVGNDFYLYKTFIYNGVQKTCEIQETTTYELSERLGKVEPALKDLEATTIGVTFYDNEDVVFKGEGKTYNAKLYSTPVVAGDVFVVKLDGITKPADSPDDSYLRFQFYDGNDNQISQTFFYASDTPVDTEILIPDGCVKLAYIFGLSASKPSVLDGEYKWSGLTFKRLSRNDARFRNVEIRVTELETLSNDWNGKVLTTYGDSVTALQGGDFNIPYNETSYRWGNRVANYLKMSKHYGRGIGGQKYAWGTNGGSITWLEKATGKMIDRSDAYTLETWDGETFTSNVSEADKSKIINGLADGSVISIRGCACSWLRITSMYPASIKDSIDAVFVMFHNDSVDGKEFSWVEGDTTDPEWAASEQYATYGGDYNISTLEGGIASTIMKLQAWMPNAVIILGTPINGQGTTGQLRPDAGGLYKQVQHVKNVGLRFSIPVIDVYATCGISGLNRTEYITDTIHPYSVAGSKMIAKAIIGGFKTILPNGVI